MLGCSENVTLFLCGFATCGARLSGDKHLLPGLGRVAACGNGIWALEFTNEASERECVRSFVSLVNEDDAGLFVAIGGFTRDAEDFARMQERRKITLIDLERLVRPMDRILPKLDDLARERLPLTPIYFLTPKA